MKPLAARACARPLTAPSTMTLLEQPNRARCAINRRIPPFSMEGNNILNSAVIGEQGFRPPKRITAFGDLIDDPPMPRIRDELLECAIYLYPDEAAADAGSRVGGSGFLVGVRTHGLPTDFWFLYAVTNAHVIDDGATVIRLTDRDGKKAVWATDEREWFRHPDSDDVAAYQIAFDPNLYKFSFIPSHDFATKSVIDCWKIGPGDDVFVVGRFINHEGKQRKQPTARFRCIGQMPWEPVPRPRPNQKPFMQESYLVEAHSIGGYSGAPVFVYIGRFNSGAGRYNTNWEFGPWLLGIDWGHINDWTPVCDETGRPANPTNPRKAQVKVNTGMMAVVPAWKLYELLFEGPLAEHRQIKTEEARKDQMKLAAIEAPATPD